MSASGKKAYERKSRNATRFKRKRQSNSKYFKRKTGKRWGNVSKSRGRSDSNKNIFFYKPLEVRHSYFLRKKRGKTFPQRHRRPFLKSYSPKNTSQFLMKNSPFEMNDDNLDLIVSGSMVSNESSEICQIGGGNEKREKCE